ncbi:hypothetical protein NG726_17295 [Pseudomonas sp. MOB-449]|nr:hypothetical protein [Pseudomonas sp. MOB-449]
MIPVSATGRRGARLAVVECLVGDQGAHHPGPLFDAGIGGAGPALSISFSFLSAHFVLLPDASVKPLPCQWQWALQAFFRGAFQVISDAFSGLKRCLLLPLFFSGLQIFRSINAHGKRPWRRACFRYLQIKTIILFLISA